MRWVFLFVLLAATLGIVASQLRAPASPEFSEQHAIGERAFLKVRSTDALTWTTRAGSCLQPSTISTLAYKPPFRQAVVISMPVTPGSSRAFLAAATTFVSARMATLTATGFPQLFWNERHGFRLPSQP